MANEDSSKFTGNLKVPPLKIVLSSHQNNAVVNIGSINDDEFKSNENDDNSNDFVEHKEPNRGSNLGNDCDKQQKKKTIKGDDFESGQPPIKASGFSPSSSSSSASDRSASTTPSSESGSLASNSTIISEHQQVKNKIEQKDDAFVSNKQDKNNKYGIKVSFNERSHNGSSITNKKISQEGNAESVNDSGAIGSKEQVLNANQRITRSSQRAAQQSKTENSGEIIGEESTSEIHDKIQESARKAKRKKCEPQDCEQDGSQSSVQPAISMANIHPSDYQLPSQNSFELYRDIRNRPYKKLMKLSHIQPKVPHGFKDYLLNGGPYLLDGNKLGVGLNGSIMDKSRNSNQNNVINLNDRVPLRLRLSNYHQKVLSYQPSGQRHSTYTIPKASEAPKNLQLGSPLYELFQDQEKARHQMLMQHLKERERSILAAEQEILRAYNKAAIADIRQKVHLSACTYFYYQERYHYLDEKTGPNGTANPKEVPHSQDNSFLCIEGGESTKSIDNNISCNDFEITSTSNPKDCKAEVQQGGISALTSSSSSSAKKDKEATDIVKTEDVVMKDVEDGFKSKDIHKDLGTNGSKSYSDTNSKSDIVMTHNTKPLNSLGDSDFKDKEGESDKINEQVKNLELDSDNSLADSSNDKDKSTKIISDEELKILNKEIFLNQLQEIDDKWDKIKKDMMVRHRNEADSLHAVQSLEWEWKAKEIGACDVRLSLKIEPEFVPKVEVEPIDY